MRVALYARVSTEQQVDNFSIPLQKERIHSYCKAMGWDNVVEYIDPGYTGSNLERPALQKLLHDLPTINRIVVYKLDRLSRSQKDTLHLIEDCFLKNNVEFVSISETLDTSSPFGRAMIGILSVFAQLERETITERMRGGRMKLVKELGYWSGGVDQHPTGYIRRERGRLEVHPDEAPLVRRVFEEYIKTKSISKIQDKFMREGLPNWRFNRIYRILQNRLYIGEVTFGGETYQGSHESLVEIDLFNRVQKLLKENKGHNYGKVKENYLSGKIECGYCGTRYDLITKYDKLKDGTKAGYKYYICNHRRMPKDYGGIKCLNKTWSKKKLENIIFGAIESLNVKDLKKKSAPQINYEHLIESIDNKIEKLLDLYVDGLIPKKKLDAKLEELNLEKSEYLERKNSTPEAIDKEIIDLVNQRIDMEQTTIEQKREIITILIEKVIVNYDDLKILWAF